MINTKENYKKVAVPQLKKLFNLKNDLAAPRILKVTLNVGVGRISKEADLIKSIEKNLGLISGQKAVATLAKKSIAGFKLREGSLVGYKVTLRGKRMYDFLDRFINAALPRSRDFRGIDRKSVDREGNLTYGVVEHVIFPEVEIEDMKKIFGFEITVTTNAGSREKGLELLKRVGFPMKRSDI